MPTGTQGALPSTRHRDPTESRAHRTARREERAGQRRPGGRDRCAAGRPHCLRREIAEGFSLVGSEGGSVEICARSLPVTAVYVLADGEWVSYILGAPEFVNRSFRELFTDGLPVATPLVGKCEPRRAGSRPGRPSAGEQLAADAVELADVALAEAAQERAQGGRGLHGAAEHDHRPAGAQRIGVVDALTARERRGDQGQQLVAGVRPPRRVIEVEVGVRQFTEAEPAGERGGEEQARVIHAAVVIEGDVYPIRLARW